MKKATFILACYAIVILFLPALIVLPFSHLYASDKLTRDSGKKSGSSSHSPIAVSVYRSEQKTTEKFDLEDYLVGVVGSEMPADFPNEALKAQALAARTYVIRRLAAGSPSGLPDGAEVTDTTANQVFHNRQDLKRIWGKDYSWKLKKIEKAVKETENQVITYNGKLITPAFFSTSNGRTENSQDYWGGRSVSYLQSVASPWDKSSPKFQVSKSMDIRTIAEKLDVSIKQGKHSLGKVKKRTKTHHVALYELAGKTFTGREIREKLKLNSTDFSFKRKGNRAVITTKGYGHDIGMSQYGAKGMAQSGASVKQIITHYYRGAAISSMQPFIKKAEKNQN